MSNSNSKRPTHNVRLLPAPGTESDAAWPFVGAAWLNKDGSFNLKLDSDLPAGSRVQVKARKSTAPAKPAKAAKAPKARKPADTPTP